jgi:hypothetical protein
MSTFLLYLFVALGVAVSVVLPLVRAFLPKPGLARARAQARWVQARPYVATAVFSLIVGLLVVAFLGDTIHTWQSALLAGYTADSTLQKITTGNQALE